LLHHYMESLFHTVEYPMKVDVNHFVPLAYIHLVNECRRSRNAGIINEYIKSAKSFRYLLEQCLGLIVF